MSIYPCQTVQKSFREFAESVGAKLSCRDEAHSCFRPGPSYSLNWCDQMKRWHVLAYEFNVGSYAVLSIIGRDAKQPV